MSIGIDLGIMLIRHKIVKIGVCQPGDTEALNFAITILQSAITAPEACLHVPSAVVITILQRAITTTEASLLGPQVSRSRLFRS